MASPTFQYVAPNRFLSFGPEFQPLQLTNLNVLIGPNGAGKSNLIELFEMLQATPTDLASFIRGGGSSSQFIWKGVKNPARTAIIETALNNIAPVQPVKHILEFAEKGERFEITDETLEEVNKRRANEDDVYFYYRYQRGHPLINTRKFPSEDFDSRSLRREDLEPQQSVFAQRRDPELYPELTKVGDVFKRITTFREWQFGRSVPLRRPQPADLPDEILLPDLSNLGLILNALEHSDRWLDLNKYLKKFLPRINHLSTRVQAGNVQIYLHEDGLKTPIPATRLSDGTIRFVALLAILLQPQKSSLICIDEPELGLHPDAVGLLGDLLLEASHITQLIVATHSDALISVLSDHSETVVVAENVNNSTQFTRLESEKLKFWLDQYQLGEIWRMGELGGNP